MRNILELLFGVSIKRRVLEILNEKIEEVQKAYNEELSTLKLRKDGDILTIRAEADARVEAVVENFEDTRSGLAKKHVREALSNLL